MCDCVYFRLDSTAFCVCCRFLRMIQSRSCLMYFVYIKSSLLNECVCMCNSFTTISFFSRHIEYQKQHYTLSLRKEKNAISFSNKARKKRTLTHTHWENVRYYVLQLKHKTIIIIKKHEQLSTKLLLLLLFEMNLYRCAKVCANAPSKTTKVTTAPNFEHLKWKIEVSIILLLYHH